MFTSSQWTNSSANGIYGSNMREMDASVGIIRAGLQEAGVENDTIIFFTSDHGPHIELCSEGGNAGPLRGGKAYSSWEGGVRVPGIVTWPGTVSPAVSSTIVSSMDIIATAVDCERGGRGGL
jgi:arylsulfatase A-like enzyme